jgi:hypothetical protein
LYAFCCKKAAYESRQVVPNSRTVKMTAQPLARAGRKNAPISLISLLRNFYANISSGAEPSKIGSLGPPGEQTCFPTKDPMAGWHLIPAPLARPTIFQRAQQVKTSQNDMVLTRLGQFRRFFGRFSRLFLDYFQVNLRLFLDGLMKN